MDIVDYIFHSLKETKIDMRDMHKSISRQKWFNRNVVLSCAAVTACIALLQIQSKKDNDRIINLEKEVEELKNLKGE